MELILNTKEDCFLCLQTILSREANELCLRNICRFLQINTCNVLLQGLKTEERGPSNLLQDTKYNFSVNLCNPCYVIAGKLSSLIHDLEVVQLQVNYYSQVLQKILEKADVTTSSATAKIGPDHLATEDTHVLNYLRKNVKLKCSARTEKALETYNLPLVKLNRLTEETVTTLTKKYNADKPPITAANVLDESDHSNDTLSSNNSTDDDDVVDDDYFNSMSSSYKSSDEDDSITSDEKRVTTVRKKYSVRRPSATSPSFDACLENPSSVVFPSNTQTGSTTRIFKLIENTSCAAPKVRIKQIFDDIPIKNCHKKGSVKEYGCPFCDTITDKKTLKKHLTARHLGKLLSFTNRDQFPDYVFERMCHHALEVELDKSEMLSTTRSDGVLLTKANAHYICYICNKTLNRRESARHHLVTCHVDNLVETLGSLPKNGNFEMPMNDSTAFGLPVSWVHRNNVMKRMNHTSAKVSTRRTYCPHCKTAFTDIRRHMLRCHPDHVFLSVQPVHQSRAEFAVSCRKIFQRETVGYGKRTRNGPVVSRQCAYCTVTHRDKIDYLRHLVGFHKEVLTEKIKALANEDNENASYPVVEAKEEVDWTTQEPDDDFGELFSEDEEQEKNEMEWTTQDPDDEFGDPLSVGKEEQEEKNELKDASSPKTKKCSNHHNTKQTLVHSLSLSIKKSGTFAVTESTECNSGNPDAVEPKVKLTDSDGKKDTLVSPSIPEVGIRTMDANLPPDSDIIVIDMAQIFADFATMYFCKQNSSNPHNHQHTCTICKKSFLKSSIKGHAVSWHPEKLLIFAKRADVPEAAFTELCCMVLAGETKRCKKVSSKNAKGTMASKPRYLCYICRKTMHCSEILPYHFVTSHADILGQALDKLQQEGNYSSKMSLAGGPHDHTLSKLRCYKRRQRTACSSKGQIPCLHCSERFLYSFDLRLHMLRFHPDQLFLSVKPAHQSLSQFAESCQKFLQNETIMCKNPKMSREFYQCAYCKYTYRRKRNFLHHLVYHHKKILTGKIEALSVENYGHEISSFTVEERKEEDRFSGPTEKSDSGSEDDLEDPLKEDD